MCDKCNDMKMVLAEIQYTQGNDYEIQRCDCCKDIVTDNDVTKAAFELVKKAIADGHVVTVGGVTFGCVDYGY